MKLISYNYKNAEEVGILIGEKVYPIVSKSGSDVLTMDILLKDWEHYFPILKKREQDIQSGTDYIFHLVKDVQQLAPVPSPTSCRDAYAFRQHVAAGRRNRRLGMLPEFDQFPVFYFTNPNSIKGSRNVYCMPDHFKKLDFELEVAIVICKKGRNIKAENADEYIGGLMIMNDWSARQLQMEEMLLSLGPAKGKDFATTIGPYLVTLDELTQYETAPKPNHIGKNWNLSMKCFVNGIQVSSGNLSDMDWTFAEIIERASYGVDLFPGDIIGSGTVGTGCFLELNGTGMRDTPGYKEQWLQDGDRVQLEITALGILDNTIVAEKTDWSILSIKK